MDVELETLGRKMREIRKSAGWRLADLAEATGLTTSYLSQIERGASIPSLTALATVAMSLGVEITELLDDFVEPTITVTRAGEGHDLRLGDGPRFHIISRLGGERPYTAITQDIPSAPSNYRHFGERFILVLGGTLRMVFGDQEHYIDSLGTIHYTGHEGQTIEGASDEQVDVLIISSPALL